jgi:hypothetical protein
VAQPLTRRQVSPVLGKARLIGDPRCLHVVAGIDFRCDPAAAQKNRERRCDKQSLQLLPPRSVPMCDLTNRTPRNPMVAPPPIKEALLIVPIVR